MHIRYLVALGALLGLVSTAQAQQSTLFGFEYQPMAKVVHGTDTLRHAWAGGMNTPQFSHIDLNGDGQADLFAFDRESLHSYTFLNVASGTGRQWQYAPQYESLFPDDLYGWVLLRDYDCDGRPDLFTDSNGDIRVFRNSAGASGRPVFTLVSSQLRFAIGNGDSNIAVGGYNMPDFRDVNGDGKLDVLTYEFSASQNMELYLNTSPGSCGGALTFRQESAQWGGIRSCGYCTQYQAQGQTQCAVYPRQPLHTPGHNVLLLDLDGDGDQDVLDGLDNCPELVRLLNQGTASTANFPATSVSSSYPTAAPIRVETFPAGYSIDTNFDGRADLVVAPNMLDNRADLTSMRNTVALYTNTTASGAPAFTQQAGGFLQNQMIDVSEAAVPTFGDISGDGLPDMLIGNLADKVNGTYRASLYYYRNVGTRTAPVFSLVTDDYLGLASQGFLGLKPVLVDLNRDGRLDLAFSAWRVSGRIYFLLNTATTGQAAAYNVADLNYFKGSGPEGSGILPYARYDMPCFTDVDNDGYVDLLLGTDETREPGMSLRYFRNRRHAQLDSTFIIANNDFGQLRVLGGRPGNLSPTVADYDGDGEADLVTTDESGLLHFYADYRHQPSSFIERTELIYNNVTMSFDTTRLGNGGDYVYNSVASADINGDGAPELYVGLEAGGVLSYATRNRAITGTHTAAALAMAFTVYPNPATGTATVETADLSRLTVLDLTGRVLRQPAAQARQHRLDLQGLAPGVYLVRATTTTGAAAVQRLVVR